jgi:hypothetical protein
MKKQNRICFLLIATGALFLTSATNNKALAAGSDGSVFATSLQDGGRLVIRRSPSLGRNVIVTLRVDGVPARGIAYGQTYDSFLRPGRHVLSVVAAPNPTFNNPWKTTLQVHVGHTYYFTAKTGSSQIILHRDR